ncbi:hypothetical protein KAJ83_01545 [Marivibrio halodurans]|uniref:Holin n=1 Tax=Marivibrio halodurans TaxID=2039722 RepID=A0A8J7UZG9_9PROT|nr:hypothetical protein [Marivibrio halodurans]MBP5855676.1 hypothetical protein [Marivibrio halodurans]
MATSVERVSQAAQKFDVAKDAALGTTGLSMPLWAEWLDEWGALYGVVAGGVVLTLRGIKIIRDWTKED